LLSGKTSATAVEGVFKNTGTCPAAFSSAQWNGFGADPTNSRFQKIPA
jgi:hypothetical protein